MNRLACVFIFLLIIPAALAQVRESVTVEVVEVPVYVTSADGTPLRQLRRENFQLIVNGKRQPIDYFDAVDFGASPVGGLRDRRERRLYLLLFDGSYTAPGHIARAQRAAELAVEKSNPATDFFAVATYTSGRGVQLASPFVNDRAAVRRAIATLSVGDLNDPLGIGLSQAEHTAWTRSSAGVADGQADPFGQQSGAGETPGQELASGSAIGERGRAALATAEMAAALRGGAANQATLKEPAQRLIELQVNGFADLAMRLAALEGQKHVVLFSEGFNSRLVHNEGRFSPDDAGPSDRLLAVLQSMSRTFHAAGVFLHTVDVAGLRHTTDPFANDSLQFLAHQTGGEFVHNRNDLAAAITDLTHRQQVVYLLGFQRRDDRGGDIDVRLTGVPRGTRVTFRPGFGKPVRNGEVDPLQLADVLINDVPQTGLRVASRIEPRAGGAEIEFALFPQEIVPQLVDRSPYVDAMLYVFDANGAAMMVKSKRIAFDEKRKDSNAPIVLRERLDAPPGRYVAKLVAHIAGTRSLGFAKREVEVTP